MKCSRCEKDAVIHLRYNGEFLCSPHFTEFLEKRVKREIRAEVQFQKNAVIGVGFSGGKDSSVTLYLLNKIFKHRKDIKLIAITIDEGIEGYRNIALEHAKNLTKTLEIEHKIFSFNEHYHHTIDEIASRNSELLPCSYCGVFRRQLLNIVARQLNVNYLATGLNLDDTVQSLIMNLARGDVERLARLGPHQNVKERLIPRIQPLRTIPEKEVFMYAVLNKIEFYHGECPYAKTAIRNEFREAIDNWENRTPGTRYAILKSYAAVRDMIKDKYTVQQLNSCSVCGEPTIGTVCKACQMLQNLNTQN